jgi:hypothetical protein
MTIIDAGKNQATKATNMAYHRAFLKFP